MTNDELFREIKDRFPDAVPHFFSRDYPFQSFCYIPSRSLYIEIFNEYPNFWQEDFDPELHPEGDECVTQSDEIMNELMHRTWSRNKKTRERAEKRLEYWETYLCRRRKKAEEAELNYIVFWDAKLIDAELWLALGCPDGRDWKREFSWIPERELDVYPLYEFTGTPQNLSRIIKHFQFFEFYWRELAVWYNNDMLKNHGRTQGYLYANRYKYIHKKPEELTDAEILRGLTISGVVHGYTTFDAKLMYEVIEKYKPVHIFDPCAGWGERTLACFEKNIKYTGIDINPCLEPGYLSMKEFYGLKDQEFIVGDGSVYENTCGDMVLTCPPYGDIEYYTDYGAENLPEDEFYVWWGRVVRASTKCRPEYFCFQINKRYRDRMLETVVENGYELIDELYFKSNKSSHFNRKKNGVNLKKESESMLVLRKAGE